MLYTSGKYIQNMFINYCSSWLKIYASYDEYGNCSNNSKLVIAQILFMLPNDVIICNITTGFVIISFATYCLLQSFKQNIITSNDLGGN